ncbi:carboxymuconolactone decarboxylase family protein [Amycolatopsis keratiniphila]|uniref:carboxymuconolactone decarboxylase family protein n=1 Tax=Amycolatopsis keratiniphila TaxID=129921 RepID=UPI00087CC2F8|nr:carboxymuconolactone decarboxylase family protein [Amycolatopsis keratiniphila]OLZ43554.1 alkylhydroperoxidase [Amycolatopsis keratiniphila subsp. nogabecina]SDU10799.1 alkylhydroperoxidase AhpD family core domain-containing protein [Amycolatopsis keratiniphila]
MQRRQSLDPADAPAKSAELLGDIIERHGSVGPMISAMANSPALLQGYLDFSRAMKRAKLPRALGEKISLALQEWIGCALCLQAHTRAARAAGLGDDDIALARQGTSTDRREAALIAYAVRVLAEPASIGDEDVAELRRHGWSDRHIADTVGLVSLNLLTGSFNLVAGLEPAPAEQSTKEKHDHVG